MAGRQVAVLTSIRQLFHTGSMAGLDDGELLERFATRNDESAFAALVALHGPMVLGVCRRILRDGHDVEDAFQATFLVLVQRAGSIRDPGRLGPWLHGVARRVAMRARAEAGRRRSRQDPVGAAHDRGGTRRETRIPGRGRRRAGRHRRGSGPAAGAVPRSGRALRPGGTLVRRGRPPALLPAGYAPEPAGPRPGAAADPAGESGSRRPWR